MAQRVTIIMTDDIDGSENASTRRFSFGGVEYEIDLSDANYDKMADALAPWVKKARKAGRRTSSRGTSRSGARTAAELAAIREWARSRGDKVSDRGRIAASIVADYDAAH